MTDCKWHSSSDVCARTLDMMEGVDWATGRKGSLAKSSNPVKLQTPHDVLDSHQQLYQAYLNKIIQSAQNSQGEHLLKFEGEKGASINFKLLLEHAMAGMKRDRDILACEEGNENARNDAMDSPMLSGVDPSTPVKKNSSRDSKAQRPPSLAATHPASYKQCTQSPQKSMPPPPAPKRMKLEPTINQKCKPSRQCRQSLPLWQQIHDPKYLTSREPVLDGPMFRHLSSDTMPDTPKVISPTFMIALPLGTLIEGANYWSETETQPRDPQDA